jgi:hypothetical protein
MTEETGAAAPVTEPAAPSAPAVSEQATPTNDSVQNTDAATENAETTDSENQDEDSSEGAPKRLSRSQRMQRKVARLSTMLAEQASELEQLRSKTSDAPQPPKEDDFNGDYFAFQRALTKWDTEQVLKETLSKVIPEQKKPDARELGREDVIDDLRERIEAAQENLPDFKQALTDLQGHIGDLSNALLEEIGESEKGEFILYHLAKNPRLAASLNRMSERDAAREIARLESKVSLPQPKRQTKAPAPLNALKGGAAPSTDLHSLAKSDDASGYWAARNKS